MLSKFELNDFKGFERLVLNDLRTVNIIVGANNAGKTAVLEAISLLLSATSTGVLKLGGFRDPPPEFLRSFLDEADIKRLNGKSDKDQLRYIEPIGAERATVITGYSESDKRCFCYASGEDASGKISGAIEANNLGQFVQRVNHGAYNTAHSPLKPYSVVSINAWPVTSALALEAYEIASEVPSFEESINTWIAAIDPRIRSLRSLKLAASERQVYVDLGLERRLPLSQVGQGTQRVLWIATKSIKASKGCLLLDEVETGIHHSFLVKFWRFIFATCAAMNAQVFATTHSYECLKALAQACEEEGNKELVSMYRIERAGEKVDVVSATQEAMIAAIESEYEVR